MARINLHLPDELHATFKAYSAIRRKSMTDLLVEMIRKSCDVREGFFMAGMKRGGKRNIAPRRKAW